MNWYDREPTIQECNERTVLARLQDGSVIAACWYPQMGGYGAKALVNLEPEGCFDVALWHNGDWPIRGEDGGNPIILHHCNHEQFRKFADDITHFESIAIPENERDDGGMHFPHEESEGIVIDAIYPNGDTIFLKKDTSSASLEGWSETPQS